MKSKRTNNIEPRSLNFIITGKSGVGKSSFLNYLIGKNHFATGDGSPVTQDYFTFASFIKDNIEYKLYDTKGVEPDTTEECKNVILSKIDEKDQSDNIYDWIHTVYYCFAAPGKRIEPFEISFLKEICQKTNIIILLTKKDLVTEKDLEKLAAQIHNEIGDAIPVIPVCSVKERTRKHISTPDGKEEVLKVSFYGLWNKLSKKLPKDLISNLFEPLGKINSNNVYDSKNILEWILKTLYPYPFDYVLFGLLSRSTKETEYSLTYFANFPENFHLEEKKHTENLKEFLNGTLNAYRILQNRCVSLRDNSLRECNLKMCSEILDFYKDINHCSPPQLHTLKTEEAYKEIYDSDFHKNALQTLQREINELTKACTEWEKCLCFDSKEKENVKSLYKKLQKVIRTYGSELINRIGNFKNVYEAELLQYGQYCIRELKSEINPTSAPVCLNDLSKEEKVFLDILRILNSDGIITAKENNVLCCYKDNFRISDKRAQEIARFLDSNR